MTCLAPISILVATPYTSEEHERYLAALGKAQLRARCSYFDQHLVRMDDGQYWVADEGCYETLMQDLVDRIVHTVRAGLMDEY